MQAPYYDLHNGLPLTTQRQAQLRCLSAFDYHAHHIDLNCRFCIGTVGFEMRSFMLLPLTPHRHFGCEPGRHELRVISSIQHLEVSLLPGPRDLEPWQICGGSIGATSRGEDWRDTDETSYSNDSELPDGPLPAKAGFL